MLKKAIFLLSFSTVLTLPLLAQSATIVDSVMEAVSSHPQMKAGVAAREQADRNVWEQRASFYPTVGVTGDFGRLRLNDKTTRANTSGSAASSWTGSEGIRLTQPLFDGFGNVNRLQGAEDRFLAAKHDLDGMAEDVAIRAARAHLNLMRTREMLTLATRFLSDTEEGRKKIALMVKGGAADEAELLQADELQTMLRNAKLGYEESFHQAEADYIEVAGAIPDGVLELGEKNWNAFVPASLDDALARNARENPHILAADRMTASLLKETAAEKAGLIPHLDAEMSYTHQDQLDVVGGETTDARAMLKLGWNFSTGGGQFARIQKSQQQQVESAARRRAMIRNIERDIRQKYASMLIADQQYALFSDRFNASKKILANFTAQFEGGKQSQLQLIAANSKVFEAETALTDSRYRQLLVRFELLNSIGTLRSALGVAPKANISQKG